MLEKDLAKDGTLLSYLYMHSLYFLDIKVIVYVLHSCIMFVSLQDNLSECIDE